MKKLVVMHEIQKKLNELLKERRPEHFMVTLESEEEQEEVVEHVTDFFQENAIRHFGGRESCLEYCLDGSMAQLQWIFGDIAASATYTNEYEGVIAMDIAHLAPKVNEAQMAYFLQKIKEVSKHATLILFLSEGFGRNQNQMADKIMTVVEHINYFPVANFLEEEFLQLGMGGK